MLGFLSTGKAAWFSIHRQRITKFLLSGFAENMVCRIMRNMLFFILLRLLFLLGSGRAQVFPEMREAITQINDTGVEPIISPESNEDGGPIHGCTCNWNMLTFRTESSYEIGGVWLSKIVANNTCKYGMKAIPVSCPGWKQEYVLNSTLTVHEKNGTCLFFPETVIKAGLRDYFPAFGKWLHLETFPLQGTYPCYNCSCFGCCLDL